MVLVVVVVGPDLSIERVFETLTSEAAAVAALRAAGRAESAATARTLRSAAGLWRGGTVVPGP
ncbi:hypothetical protein GCM10027047_17970 [Rhodococcus aerolatus]